MSMPPNLSARANKPNKPGLLRLYVSLAGSIIAWSFVLYFYWLVFAYSHELSLFFFYAILLVVPFSLGAVFCGVSGHRYYHYMPKSEHVYASILVPAVAYSYLIDMFNLKHYVLYAIVGFVRVTAVFCGVSGHRYYHYMPKSEHVYASILAPAVAYLYLIDMFNLKHYVLYAIVGFVCVTAVGAAVLEDKRNKK